MEFDREQIIKAFECCHTLSSDCLSCPFLEDSKACAGLSLMALALIRELADENEFHRKTISENARMALEVTIDEIEKAKADTVRKMQKRLKEYLDDFYTTDEDALLDVPDLIDQIAREVLEEDKSYSWVITENGCVITCPNCGERLELCYPDGTEVRYLPHCPWCGKKLDK